MKKRIILFSLLMSLSALVIFAVVSTFMYHTKIEDNTVRHMSVYMLSYSKNKEKFVSFDDAAARALSEETGGARVTFISPDGTVLGDSQVGSAALGNHIDRAEVAAALKNGSGNAARGSDSINTSLIYYCELFDNTQNEEYPKILVRLAEKGASVWSVLFSVIPLLIFFIVIEAALCWALASFSVRHILKPVEDFGVKAMSGEFTAPYRELENLSVIFGDFKREQEIAVDQMKADRPKENVVLDNMEHGMVILKDIDDVVLINKAAAKVLEFKEGDKILFGIARDNELLKAVESKKGGLFYRTYAGEEYALRFSRVEEMDAIVALITQVTAIRRAERTKNDFIANVTHEMNTPLTAISGFAELIATGLEPKENEKRAQIILNQSLKLKALIKSILNYSAIEAESLPSETFDLKDVLAAAVADFEPAAINAGLKLTLDSESNLLINARQTRVREVADNFISNALRYTKQGEIKVKAYKKGGKVRLEVTDTGIGIAKENLSRIFDRFFTVDSSHSSGGFGLGLAIVKKLAALNNWTVGINSTLGVGTTIWIIF